MTLALNPEVRNWDLSQLMIVFMGIGISSGFAEGDVLELDPVAETFGFKVGADGEVTRYRINNKVNKGSLNLMQTSIANSLLSALATLDESTPGGAGVGPFLINDLQGTTIISGSFAWISKRPKSTFGAAPGTRTWEITCVVTERIDGNN